MATTFIMKPIVLANHPGQRSAPSRHFPKAAATAIVKGDVVLLSSGLAVVDNTDPAAGAIVGVAAETITAAQNKTRVAVYPAYPGSIFKGNLIGTFAAADVGTRYGIGTSSSIAGPERAETSAIRVQILGLADAPPGYAAPAVDDVNAPVFFSFLPNKTIYDVSTSD